MNDQRSDEWLAERVGHVTASTIINVTKAKTTACYQNYLSKLACERLVGRPAENFVSKEMEAGIEAEPQARAFYELETGFSVQEVGFIKHPTIEFSGASPDGLVGDDGLVEIKCPQPTKHIKNLTKGTIDEVYIYQMQWQMECTGRKWCDFVSFNDSFPDHLKIVIQRIEADEKMLSILRQEVEAFLNDIDLTINRINNCKKKEI